MVTYDFGGKVAFVSGAANGQGRATAAAFAAAGAAVTLFDIDADGVDDARARIEERGGVALSVVGDVANENDVARAIEATVTSFERLDFAFNNAAIEGQFGPMAEYDAADWDRVIAVDLRGVWLCMKYQILQMRRQDGGSIVNNSSTAGTHAEPEMTAYAAAKHGVLALTRNAAVEEAPNNIRVNVVCPGAIDTPMLHRGAALFPGVTEREISKTPLGRIGRADEVASAVVWLASDASSFTTAQVLYVDGGYNLGITSDVVYSSLS